MTIRCIVDNLYADIKSGMARIVNSQKDDAKPFVLKSIKSGKEIDFSITYTGVITKAESPGIIHFKPGKIKLVAKTHRERRTLPQNDTLRGIERMIFWVDNGRQPDDEEMYYIHEAMIERYSVPVFNPFLNRQEQKRTSDPTMTTSEMAKIIEGALGELAQKDIPDEILDATADDIGNLFEAWQNWIETEDGKKFKAEFPVKSWEDYLSRHKRCEFCNKPGTDSNPLERIHIISKGADETTYEEPWNWIAGHHQHHMYAHAVGWREVIKEYPALKNKIEFALKKALEEEI